MRDPLDLVLSPLTLVIGLLVLGLVPGLVLRVLVRLYPPDDPRRTELVAELHAVPLGEQPTWVAQQVETALLDGLPARVRHLRQRRPARMRQRERVLSPRTTPGAGATTAAAAAVAGWYCIFISVVWPAGPLLTYVLPLALALLLPLYLLVAVALYRRRRRRRTRGRSNR